MSKKKILSIFAIVCLSVSGIISCGSANYKFSELRDGYYQSVTSKYKVVAVSGVRESDYKVDGVITPLTDYTLITVEPTQFNASDSYLYTVKFGDSEYSGQLALHPFAKSYSVELPQNASNQDISFSITKNNADVEVINLTSSATNALTVKQAMDIANNALKGIDTQNTELYARLVSGQNLNWYVRYAGEVTYSVLLDATTGEVLAVKK